MKVYVWCLCGVCGVYRVWCLCGVHIAGCGECAVYLCVVCVLSGVCCGHVGRMSVECVCGVGVWCLCLEWVWCVFVLWVYVVCCVCVF